MPRNTPSAEEPSINRLDFDANRAERVTDSRNTRRSLLDDDVSFMNEVADGIIERDRQRIKREATRTVSLVWSILSCLCAGSITTFSLYGPRFQEHLHYSQYEINGVSITSSIAMYLTVPFFGYICDRYSPRPLTFLSAILFCLGYVLAAFTYRSGPPDEGGWSYGWMIVAFFAIGIATLCMYLAAVTTCAKNYATARYRGLVLSAPIAAFGLSGMWESLVGDHLLSDTLPDGSKGPVNVFKYFIFLAGLLTGVGIIGCFALNIVNEEDLIDHGIEALEQSGLLNESEFFRPSNEQTNYGTLHQSVSTLSDTENNHEAELDLTASQFLKRSEERARLREKKNWLLNHESRKFLGDRTMWLLGAGFLLATGPGESYINNLGTVIPTLTPRHYMDRAHPPAGLVSTHVSFIAITSTLARLISGTLSDLLSPPSKRDGPPTAQPRFGRLALLILSAFILVLGFLNLALPFLTPQIPALFHISSILVGLGYGAVFSLVPIIISVVWGPENFGTNWGIIAMTPAIGASLWSLVYSVGYSRAAAALSRRDAGTLKIKEGECIGYDCFAGWAWGCALSGTAAMILWALAWKTWRSRKVEV